MLLLLVLPLAGVQAQRLWLALHAPGALAVRAEQPGRYWVVIAGNTIWLILFLGSAVSVYWWASGFIVVLALAMLLFASARYGDLRRLAKRGAWLGLDGQVRSRADRPRSYASWMVIGVGMIVVEAAAAAFLLWQVLAPH